ncbi:hypothetical protein AAZX31_15G192400 [Glycine max]|uniref:Uncharacterized protein n=1 Tax=Glycine max TaxID=3847 RepID=I1MI36_SOYBN|nr:cytochrome P450 82A2 [Glycine max]KAG4957282.1 hypothetical protein JHK85_043662 [Glycine max]KAG5106040.1 hypothetical protein JHK82_043010 [Glycine max]KAH1148061.1 hypothetical protein GYH30_042962 [Glycine max]KRH12905.1 hypothetical protein GLYMA_15G203500v4 [Glycine max]|eukprot:XP_003546624.1 cytochrome P450 82A2 [Glycine max]
MDLVLNTTTIGVGVVSLILLYLFLCRRSSKSGEEGPPTVAGAWPIIGHLPLLLGSKTPHKTLGDLADKYGPIFSIKLGAKNAVVISNWEMAKECYTTNDIAVSSLPNLISANLLCYNRSMILVAPYGPYWRQMRKILMSEFLSPSRVEQLHHVRVSEVQNSITDLFGAWRSNKNVESGCALVELKQWFSLLVFNMILRMVCGKRYFSATTSDDEKAKRCVKAVDEFVRLAATFTVGDTIPYLRWFDFGGYEKDMRETGKELDEIIGEWLEEHRQKRKMGENVQDFMNVLLSLLEGKTIEGMNVDIVIKSFVLTIIQAATEASITTLVWATSLILNNPSVLEKLKAELDIQVGKERYICESDLSKLTYLQAVVKETLRLYPPGPLSRPREFEEDCTIGGYTVKKGTRLITNLSKIHTDHNVWSNPLEFKPERFLTTDKDIDMKGQHFQLLPFGSGRRICPGVNLGLQTVHLTLASFLHSFEILNPSTEPLDMTEVFGVTNSKATSLEILIKPRLSPSCYESM